MIKLSNLIKEDQAIEFAKSKLNVRESMDNFHPDSNFYPHYIADDIMPLLKNSKMTTNTEINHIIDKELGYKLTKEQRIKVMKYMSKYHGIRIAV